MDALRDEMGELFGRGHTLNKVLSVWAVFEALFEVIRDSASFEFMLCSLKCTIQSAKSLADGDDSRR